MEAISENNAKIIVNGAMPTILTENTQMIQLFQNFISNAIKFKGAIDPEVIISAEENPTHWVFKIKDNGLGIEKEYFERIFVIFQRLNNRTEYPGTGIGLAICKKIVERHGGQIWVESKLGKGTTFSFSIKK